MTCGHFRQKQRLRRSLCRATGYERELMHEILISSTFLGLEHIRERVVTLVERRTATIRGELIMAKPNGTAAASMDLARRADLVILLLGRRYGSIDAGYGMSNTHLEFEAARRQGTRVLAYDVRGIGDVDGIPVDEPPESTGHQRRQRNFIRYANAGDDRLPGLAISTIDMLLAAIEGDLDRELPLLPAEHPLPDADYNIDLSTLSASHLVQTMSTSISECGARMLIVDASSIGAANWDELAAPAQHKLRRLKQECKAFGVDAHIANEFLRGIAQSDRTRAGKALAALRREHIHKLKPFDYGVALVRDESEIRFLKAIALQVDRMDVFTAAELPDDAFPENWQVYGFDSDALEHCALSKPLHGVAQTWIDEVRATLVEPATAPAAMARADRVGGPRRSGTDDPVDDRATSTRELVAACKTVHDCERAGTTDPGTVRLRVAEALRISLTSADARLAQLDTAGFVRRRGDDVRLGSAGHMVLGTVERSTSAQPEREGRTRPWRPVVDYVPSRESLGTFALD